MEPSALPRRRSTLQSLPSQSALWETHRQLPWAFSLVVVGDSELEWKLRTLSTCVCTFNLSAYKTKRPSFLKRSLVAVWPVKRWIRRPFGAVIVSS